MGQDILPGIGPLIISREPVDGPARGGNPFGAGIIDQSNLYFNLTRPFGPCRLIDPLRIRRRQNANHEFDIPTLVTS